MNRILVRLGTTVLMLCAMSFAPAHAFVDPPTFEPTAPNSAQPVRVMMRMGHCHFFGVTADSPPMRIERSPGIVDVIAPGFITFDPFCNMPPYIQHFDLGALPAGDYQVRIWIIDGTNGYVETIQVASALLTVTLGPASSTIPMIGTPAAIVLGLSIFLVALLAIGRRRGPMLAIAALLGSVSVSAQSGEKILMVLLSASPNAPTPEMVVDPVEYLAGYLGGLSSGFAAENPSLPLPSLGTTAGAALVACLITGSPAQFTRSFP